LLLGVALDDQMGSHRLLVVTELMPRGSFFDLMHSKRVVAGLGARLKMAADAARGLAYLASREPPAVHGDISAHNLLVHGDWSAKVLCSISAVAPPLTPRCPSPPLQLCDFGLATVRRIEERGLEEQNARREEEHLAQQQHASQSFRDYSSIQFFRPEQFVPIRPQTRSALYLAPEVLHGEPATPASDAFGLATLVNEAITQRRPFEGRSMVCLPQLVSRGERPETPAAPLEHDALETLCHAVFACWGDDAVERLNAVDLLDAIMAALSHIPVDVPKQMVARRRTMVRRSSLAKEPWEIEAVECVMHAQLGAGAFSAVFR
jgi:serine/threonine protein kinase